MKVGDPLDAETQMGSLISTAHRDRVHWFVERGIEEGAEVVTGGAHGEGKGAFYQPTVLANVDNAWTSRRRRSSAPSSRSSRSRTRRTRSASRTTSSTA